MAINEWKLWKKLKIAKEEKEEVEAGKELAAVADFLKEIEVRGTAKELERMKEMVKEEGIIREELKGENLRKQIEFFDKILKDYEFFEDDVDINGLRLKKIAKELLAKAEKAGMAELVKEKRKDIKWR